jgi:superfamily II DNA/RNA helicase
LAQQVTDAVRKLASDMRCRSTVVVGGVAYGSQIQALSGHLDILIATPGRLIDHMASGKVDFSRVNMVVLDEADKMLDMGFAKPVDRILAAIEKAKPHGQKNPQMFLFTATSTKAVEAMAARALYNPHKVTLSSPTVSNDQIEQTIYRADSKDHKMALLQALLGQADVGQAIIFSATKHGADKLADQLNATGYASAALHGGMKQGARKRTLDQLHSKKVKFLVATDVAARGIDVKNLGHVINFDLPQVAEDYIHRIGRTGRAGAKGKAISLVSTSDFPMMRDIEKMLKQKLNLQMMPGLEPRQTVGDFERQGALAPRLGARSGGSRGGQQHHSGRPGDHYGSSPNRPQRDSQRSGYSSRSR